VLAPSAKEAIISLLQQYQDVFTFGPSEMPERSTTAAAEVKKLLEAGFIRECHYPEWVSNVILVKKPNGTLADMSRFH